MAQVGIVATRQQAAYVATSACHKSCHQKKKGPKAFSLILTGDLSDVRFATATLPCIPLYWCKLINATTLKHVFFS